jgi:hypothetical protein
MTLAEQILAWITVALLVTAIIQSAIIGSLARHITHLEKQLDLNRGSSHAHRVRPPQS